MKYVQIGVVLVGWRRKRCRKSAEYRLTDGMGDVVNCNLLSSFGCISRFGTEGVKRKKWLKEVVLTVMCDVKQIYGRRRVRTSNQTNNVFRRHRDWSSFTGVVRCRRDCRMTDGMDQ
jgi:hypothetical protein